jgi:hypothetical protein
MPGEEVPRSKGRGGRPRKYANPAARERAYRAQRRAAARVEMEKRWQQGLSDARAALHASPWLAPMPKELGVRVFDAV